MRQLAYIVVLILAAAAAGWAGGPLQGSGGGLVDLTTTVTGTLPPANGGTGSTDVPNEADILIGVPGGGRFHSRAFHGDGAITQTGAFSIGDAVISNSKIANSTIDLTAKVAGALPVANGGTGGATASDARAALASPGLGIPIVVGVGRVVATTTAIPVGAPIATYMVGGSDGSFIVSGCFLVTADTATTIQLQVGYTDEGGNARTLVLNTSSIVGVIAPNTAATGAFEGIPVHIRAKAATAISVFTAFTVSSSMTYNVEAVIQQLR